jgi:soluble lytic murein transglycosylase-like protein
VRLLRPVALLVCVAAFGFGASAAYTVRPGDTLTAVASRLGVQVADLARANAISDPNRLVAGRSLAVPTVDHGSGYPARLRNTPERLALVPAFRRWAAANGLPVDLLMATTWLESGWQRSVVSPTGAIGIGQLMPDTVRFVRGELIGVPSLDPRVPEHNIRMSARYLRWLLDGAHGDVALALGGYYQGPRSIRTIGPYSDTVAYVAGVLALRPRFRT